MVVVEVEVMVSMAGFGSTFISGEGAVNQQSRYKQAQILYYTIYHRVEMVLIAANWSISLRPAWVNGHFCGVELEKTLYIYMWRI